MGRMKVRIKKRFLKTVDAIKSFPSWFMKHMRLFRSAIVKQWYRFLHNLKTKRGRKAIVKSLLFHIFTMWFAIFFLLPTLWMLVNSLRSESAIIENISSWRTFLPPEAPLETWLNAYQDVFDRFDMFGSMLLSVQYAAALIAGTLLINSLAGYALAKFDIPFKNFWISFIILLIIVPVETTIVPLYVVVERVGLVGRFSGLFVPALANAFNIFLFRQFFLSIPKDLEEAAIIDGASRLSIFFRIVIPLSKPVFATVSIFAFIHAWNDFLWPILVLGGQQRYPLQVYLTELINIDPVFTNQVLAALTIATIPMLLIYSFFQKYIVHGVAHTGIK